MNWRESLFVAIREGTYAKDAKANSLANDPGLLHLLHMHFPESQRNDSAEKDPDRLGRALERPKEPGNRASRRAC